ncbi:MAG: c-di-GMP phosphodiesterase [Phycisphaerae bacterium]|nr:MAG: c-di-GMP phosphodiesterase [Phycisphaerae bacterium]
MLRVSIGEARAGMVLARGIPHPTSPRAMLLRDGARLETSTVDRLRAMKVREVWVRYPGLEDLAQYVNPEFESACRELTADLSASFDAVMAQTDVELDFGAYRRAVGGMLERVLENPKAAMLMGEMQGANELGRHGSAVCALSVLMGLQLDSYIVRERSRLSSAVAKDLSPLGVGAMFHDLGMTRLAPEVLARWEATGDETDEAWREHVPLGFAMVKDRLEPAAAGVVLHHHQRFDGKGFPCLPHLGGSCVSPRGSGVHVFARITAAADVFDRARYRGGRVEPAVRALRRVREATLGGAIDPVVFAALLGAAPAYGPGMLVTLSDGRRAAVVGRTPGRPCRPVVRVVDPYGVAGRAGEEIDLSRVEGLSIESVGGERVAEDNFEPAYEGEFDLLAAHRRMGLASTPMEEKAA